MRDQHLKGTDSLEALAGWRRESCWARPEHTVWGGQVCSSQCEHNTASGLTFHGGYSGVPAEQTAEFKAGGLETTWETNVTV